ncbi:hypothetical protein ES707_12505 [subsurface metagenome]
MGKYSNEDHEGLSGDIVSPASKVLSFVRDNLDGILALAGAVFSLVLVAYLQIHIGHLAYTVSGIFCFLACVTYLVLKYRHKLASISSILDLQASPSILLLSDIVFFALLIYSLWSFAFRPEPYVRPLGYFISIAAMSAILAAKILFLPSKNSRIPFTLFQIILVALSLQWSVLILFPSIVGADPWYHQSITLSMLDEGHIVESYQGLPIMQLAIGETSLITALNYKMATMFSISLLQVVCDTLFIFLIGRLVFNAKIGMLAALLMGVANWHIFFGYWTIPNTLGATFVVIILYLVLKFQRDRTTVVVPLCGLFMVALLLTHAIAVLWLAILLFTLWLVFIVYNRFFKERVATLPVFAIALLFIVATLSWWTFGTGHTRTLVLLTEHDFEPSVGLTYAIGSAPTEVTPLPEATPPAEVTPPAWETLSGAPFELLFNSLGMFLFLAVSFIGCFYMLSRRFSNPYTFFMSIAGVLILSIGYFPMLAGRSAIEHRWWYMAQILLSIPLAVAISLLFGLFKKKYLKAGLVVVLIFVLTFLSIIGLPSNETNRTFSKNQIVRHGFTTSELEALHTVSANYEGSIGVDPWYAVATNTPGLFINKSEDRLKSMQSCLLTKDFSQSSDQMLLIRDEIVAHPMGWGTGTIYKLNYDPRRFLTEQGFHKVYDSGSVGGFIR